MCQTSKHLWADLKGFWKCHRPKWRIPKVILTNGIAIGYWSEITKSEYDELIKREYEVQKC